MVKITEILKKKRCGEELTEEEIKLFVDMAVKGSAEDCQIGAMLMAMFLNGLTTDETVYLTKAMVNSGEVLSWSSDYVADKHSTGGVGDKVSIPLVPALAACGLKVPMISGRGLDFSGGTLDKLESIPGYQVTCSIADLKRKMDSVGCFISGTNKQLTPGDQILYKVRDVTATVDTLTLCCASILSKKIAEGTKHLVIDVKVGTASFFKNYVDAKMMADLLIKVCKGLGVEARAVLTRMTSPIGYTIGNALEIEESIQCLKGRGPLELNELVEEMGGHLLEMSKLAETLQEGKLKIRKVLKSGLALEKFKEMIMIHGVLENTAQELCFGDIWSVLPKAPHVTCIHAKSTGLVQDINGLSLAKVVHSLGAGRTSPGQPIDYSVGIRLLKSCNDPILKGEVWAEVHHVEDKQRIENLLYDVEGAISIHDQPTNIANIVLEVVS